MSVETRHFVRISLLMRPEQGNAAPKLPITPGIRTLNLVYLVLQMKQT